MGVAPTRTCCSCRSRRATGELWRIAADANGRAVVGAGRPGRGAWVCRDEATCLERLSGASLSRALRRAIDEASIAALRAALGGG